MRLLLREKQLAKALPALLERLRPPSAGLAPSTYGRPGIGVSLALTRQVANHGTDAFVDGKTGG